MDILWTQLLKEDYFSGYLLHWQCPLLQLIEGEKILNVLHDMVTLILRMCFLYPFC